MKKNLKKDEAILLGLYRERKALSNLLRNNRKINLDMIEYWRTHTPSRKKRLYRSAILRGVRFIAKFDDDYYNSGSNFAITGFDYLANLDITMYITKRLSKDELLNSPIYVVKNELWDMFSYMGKVNNKYTDLWTLDNNSKWIKRKVLLIIYKMDTK